MTTQNNYDSNSIQILKGLEAVRKRPGMYIGSTGIEGLHHLIKEIVDNSVDEALAGHCHAIKVRVGRDGTVSVADDGRGIPVDRHPETGLTGLETVLTTLHAGGKFDGGAYKVSGGLHGVGASVVNALSAQLTADVSRDGWLHRQTYERGIPTGPIQQVKPTRQTGTTISWTADPTIFATTTYDFQRLAEHAPSKRPTSTSGLQHQPGQLRIPRSRTSTATWKRDPTFSRTGIASRWCKQHLSQDRNPDQPGAYSTASAHTDAADVEDQRSCLLRRTRRAQATTSPPKSVPTPTAS